MKNAKSNVESNLMLKVRVRAASRAVLECGAEGDEPIRFHWIDIIIVIIILILLIIITVLMMMIQFSIQAHKVPLEKKSDSA